MRRAKCGDGSRESLANFGNPIGMADRAPRRIMNANVRTRVCVFPKTSARPEAFVPRSLSPQSGARVGVRGAWR